jgi:hypothetical protein
MEQHRLLKLTARLHRKPGGFIFGGGMPQIARDGSFELNMNADKALPFFTPEGERTWVNGWDPQPIYPEQQDVAFQADTVFRLHGDGDHSIWTILEANPKDHIAEYIYVVEGERVSRVRVQIEPLTESHCRVHVSYVHTATSEKGLHFIAAVSEPAYAQKMKDWQRMVSAATR